MGAPGAPSVRRPGSAPGGPSCAHPTRASAPEPGKRSGAPCACSSSSPKRASGVNICRSGQKRVRVPVVFLVTLPMMRGPPPSGERAVRPRRRRRTPGTPRRKEIRCVAPSRSTSTSSRSDKRVDDRGADAVQAPGRGVGATAELPPACSLVMTTSTPVSAGLGLDVDGDAAAAVAHLDRAVGVQDDLDALAVTGQRLVDGVVDDLPQAVVEAAKSLKPRYIPGACVRLPDPRAPTGGAPCSLLPAAADEALAAGFARAGAASVDRGSFTSEATRGFPSLDAARWSNDPADRPNGRRWMSDRSHLGYASGERHAAASREHLRDVRMLYRSNRQEPKHVRSRPEAKWTPRWLRARRSPQSTVATVAARRPTSA